MSVPDPTAPSAPRTSPPGKAPWGPRPPAARRHTWSALLAVAIVALAVAALRYSRPLVPRPRPAPVPTLVARVASSPVPFQPEVESQNYRVAEASGRVEVLREALWKLVATGDVLTKDDLIRTGIGRALLQLAGGTEIEIRDRVELRLDSITRAGASVDLRRGRLTASTPRGHSISITAAHTRTINETDKPARIIVTADGQGRVAVATTQGSARFEAAGKTVVVPAGQETRAEPGAPPLNPETIAEDVLLRVVWPTGERHEERLAVAGTAKPGSLVRVNGAAAPLDKAGHFGVSIPLREGPNAIDVEAEDAAGRLKHERREVRKLATSDPDLVPLAKELWPK